MNTLLILFLVTISVAVLAPRIFALLLILGAYLIAGMGILVGGTIMGILEVPRRVLRSMDNRICILRYGMSRKEWVRRNLLG